MFSDITRILASIVIVIGLVVIIGWLIDLDTLKSIVPTWVTMKFSTAVSFLMSGIVVMLMNEYRNNNSEFARIFLFAPLIIILFFMATLLVTTLMGTSSGVSSLFVQEDPGAIGSVKAGTPSLGTMVNFILIIGVGFTSLLTDIRHSKYSLYSGAIVLVIGIIALVGYGIGDPTLYYQVEGISGAMAIHTAIAFSLVGIGMMTVVKSERKSEEISLNKFSLPISIKLVIFFLIAAMIPIIVVDVISFDLSQSSLEKETFQALNEQANSNIVQIEGFFKERLADAEVTSQIVLLKEEIPILSQYVDDRTNPAYVESAAKVTERISLIEAAYGYDTISLTNSEGRIVFVSEDPLGTIIGVPLQDLDLLSYEQGKNDIYISHVLDDVGYDGLPDLFVTAPIKEDDNLIGVLVLDVPIQRLLSEFARATYFGETGESLIVSDVDGEMTILHPLRFHDDAASLDMEMLMQQGQVGPAKKSLLGLDGVGFKKDYRNEEVLAAWRYSPALDWGLVSKIDTSEAFAPIKQLEQDMTILALVFITGIFAFGISAARSISKPITKLRDLAHDISEGKLDSQLAITSSDEIGKLTEMLNETAVKLKQVNIQKDEFSSMITHELKTPLVPIRGYCEMLKNPKFGELNEDQLDAINEIEKNSGELLELIQHVLNAQKIELHKMKFEITDIELDKYMKDKHAGMSSMMKEKGIEFVNSAESGLTVKADVAKLNEIFTNLVSNAVDFTPNEGGRIEISAIDDGEFIQFFVKDNGEGIAKDKQGGMFKKFYQVDTTATRKHGGSGLGLAICMGYIEEMKGKMWLESDKGQGATFFFTLPKSD